MHQAQYGAVSLYRVYCVNCDAYSLVLEGFTVCCEKPIKGYPTKFKRMTLANSNKKKPSKEIQKIILSVQMNKCIYCEGEFGKLVSKKGKLEQIKLCWDHYIPFDYAQDSCPENFVASCYLCNSIKHSKMFFTLKECIDYIMLQRRTKHIFNE